VLSLPPTVRIWLATAPTDMRLGFDGLAARVRQGLGADPLSGQYFVFIGRRADRLKILYWDTGGYALWSKRLERGTFHLPAPGADAAVRLSPAELAMLLEGIDPAGTRRRRRLGAMNANINYY
jgi:transposase